VHLNVVAPIEFLILAITAAGIAVAFAASLRVIRERQPFGQSAAQLAFVWLVPFIGPLVTIQLLRREPERQRAEEPDDPGEVGERIDQRSSHRPSRHEDEAEEADPTSHDP
jgi:hypothetical protein